MLCGVVPERLVPITEVWDGEVFSGLADGRIRAAVLECKLQIGLGVLAIVGAPSASLTTAEYFAYAWFRAGPDLHRPGWHAYNL